jgi:hypothetical protein
MDEVLKAIEGYNGLDLISCIGTKLANVFQPFSLRLYSCPFEQRFSNVDSNDPASAVLRQGNGIVALPAAEVDHRFSA